MSESGYLPPPHHALLDNFLLFSGRPRFDFTHMKDNSTHSTPQQFKTTPLFEKKKFIGNEMQKPVNSLRCFCWPWDLLLFFSLLVFHSLCGVSGTSGISIPFRSSNLFPEGFDWDASHHRFILGSTSSGSLITVAGDGDVEEFTRDEDYASQAGVFGVLIDGKGNRVIAAVHSMGSNFSGVAAYDLDTKKRLFFTRLDRVGVDEAEMQCANDVAVDTEGNVYVTNCRANFLWKVTKDGSPSVFVKDVEFTSQPIIVDSPPIAVICGLNGIVFHKNGYLLVSQTNSGALFRVTLNPKTVHLVTMEEKLPMADGMALREDGTLVVVSTTIVWLLRSTSDWMTAEILDTVSLNSSDFITSVTLKRDSVYVLPSFLSDTSPRETFELREIVFPTEAGDNDPLWLIGLLILAVFVVAMWRLQMGNFYTQFKRKRA